MLLSLVLPLALAIQSVSGIVAQSPFAQDHEQPEYPPVRNWAVGDKQGTNFTLASKTPGAVVRFLGMTFARTDDIFRIAAIHLHYTDGTSQYVGNRSAPVWLQLPLDPDDSRMTRFEVGVITHRDRHNEYPNSFKVAELRVDSEQRWSSVNLEYGYTYGNQYKFNLGNGLLLGLEGTADEDQIYSLGATFASWPRRKIERPHDLGELRQISEGVF